MLGESVETAAGDPTRAGMAIRVPGTNPFIVGDPSVEGNLFYEFLRRFEDKVTCFLLNTGGVGEIPNPEDRAKPVRPANRPWKPGIGYVTRALFRNTGTWEKNPDFGTDELVDGVTDEKNRPYDMSPFSTRKQYDSATREKAVVALNQDRVKHLEKYPNLDPAILKGFVLSHKMR
jgi:phosphoenolpyruvate carboxykinase (ATP)